MTRSNSRKMKVPIRSRTEAGVALVAALLLLLVITAIAVTLMYTVNTEQHLQRTDSASNLAYYAAQSGMEKMMSDLDNLYISNPAPTAAQIAVVANSANQPVLPGVAFPEYTITVLPPPAPGPNNAELLSSGPNAGLMGTVQPLTLTVTAVRPGGEQARLSSTVQVAQIPIFQFGAFTQGDMSYFAGGDFPVGGRVQANGNLFITSGARLIFRSQVRAAGDVIRDQLANGVAASSGYTGQVLVPEVAGACDGVPPSSPPASCRALQLTTSPPEESATGGPVVANGGTGSVNTQWQAISQQTYNSMILSGSTGAQKLTFPTADPIQMIRRAPLTGESPTSPVGASRLDNQAQIRVYLSDSPTELRGGASDPGNIRLANWPNPNGLDYVRGVPVDAPGTTCHHNNACTYFSQAQRGFQGDWNTVAVADQQNGHSPKAPQPEAPLITTTDWNLLDGWLRVEVVHSDGSVAAVTQEWLELGFARGLQPPTVPGGNTVNPNAILILQEPANRNPGDPLTGSSSNINWYPINMYDVREGEFREGNSNNCNVGGVMNLVEIDVGNLNRWLQGLIGASGSQVDYQKQNGYVLYFSDRRGMLPNVDLGQTVKNGQYGFEDVVNPADAAGNPNGVLDVGEDLDGTGAQSRQVEKYGGENLGLGFGTPQPQRPNQAFSPPNTPVSCDVARKNWVSGARHAVRLVDGGLGNVPFRPDNNKGGFTLASENPAYILGDYNSRWNAPFADGDGHVSSAAIADAVTLLSNNWQDINSFNNPTSAAGRPASTTSYRVAIATGRNLSFPNAAVAGNPPKDFGTDGGMHNFLRFLEGWGSTKTVNYMGSMVSPYYSQYATGVFKCCGMVYQPPTRKYQFDLDFQDATKMPPGTPVLRNVINLGFQQIFN